ncbi:Golgi transport complex subunit 6 [Chytridiales sp. JEL 0842]|nr:Golgi transport complex subunit 6 [Chytridiales sp. JEL 0842]
MLTTKLHKILNTSIDDQASLEALTVLSTFYTTNNASNRRALRGEMESRTMAYNRKFLDSFDIVNQQMKAVEQQVMEINECCAEMQRKLNTAQNDTATLIKQTEELKFKSAKMTVREGLASTFINRFLPSDLELQILSGQTGEIGDEFLAALNRLHEISEDCKALLITENQRAGLEIMETVSGYQEKAYDRLFRWVQAECNGLNREVPEITPSIRNGVAALKRRPALLQAIIENIAQVRQSALVRGFLDALTKGGPDGVPRPIEMLAHDPLRYVGDMLAWIHQASVVERELIESLFGSFQQDGHSHIKVLRQSPTTLNGEDRYDGVPLSQIMDKVMDKISRPLRVRIDEVLTSNHSVTTLYKVASLVQFYWKTIDAVVGTNTRFGQVLGEISNAAFHNFFEAIRSHVAQPITSSQKPKGDLLPLPAVKDAMLQMKEILASHESRPISEPENDSEGVYARVLSATLDPLLEMYSSNSAGLPPFENALYTLNSLTLIGSTVAVHSNPLTTAYLQRMEQQMDAQVQVLIDDQYQQTLAQSGLLPLITAIDANSGKVPLSRVPELEAKSIKTVLANLDVFLCNAGFDAASRISRLTSTKIVARVLKGAFKMFLGAYAKLYDAVMDPANRYEFPATVMGRSVEEIETLLEVVE